MIIKDMISVGEVPSFEQLTNAQKLLLSLNELENKMQSMYPHYYFKITSGIRSMDKHLSIYAKLREQDEKNGLPLRHIPMDSAHLTGRGADFICPQMKIGELYDWLYRDEISTLCEDIGLHFETQKSSPDHIHAQDVPPASGKLFFDA